MFLRLRWFVAGILSALGGGAYVIVKLRRLRARLTPRNVGRVGALAFANALDAAGRAVGNRGDDPARD